MSVHSNVERVELEYVTVYTFLVVFARNVVAEAKEAARACLRDLQTQMRQAMSFQKAKGSFITGQQTLSTWYLP